MKDHYGKKIIISVGTLLFINIQQFLFLPILSRNLGVEIYGIWSQVITAINLILPVVLFALPITFVRFSAGLKDPDKISSNYYTMLFFIILSSVVWVIIFYFLSPFINSTFIETKKPILNIVRISSLLLIAYSLSQFSSNYFRSFQMEKTYSLFQILQSSGVLLLMIIVIRLGYGLFECILSIIIVYAILFIVSQYIIYKEIGFSIPDLKLLKPFLIFSLPLIPIGLINWVINASDRYVIGYFFQVIEVAKYSAAYTVAMIIQLFYAPFYFLLLPKLTELIESQNFYALNKVIHYSNKLPLLVSIPSIIGFYVLYKEIFSFILGETMDVSNLLIPMISLGYVFYLTGSFYDHILILSKNTKYSLYGNIFAGIINLIGNIILVPLFGIMGAAIMTMLTFLIQMLYFKNISQKYYNIKLNWNFLWKSILAATIMGIFIYVLKPSLQMFGNEITLLVLIPVGAIIYLSVSIFIGVIKKEELILIKSLISTK